MSTSSYHECDEMPGAGELRPRAYGNAITDIYLDDEGMWATNEEYATGIDYCPFCGQSEEDIRDSDGAP